MSQSKAAVEKYSKATRILHHVHTAAFIVLFLTGLVLFVPQLGFLAQGSWTRIVHRLAAVIFIVAPIAYLVMRPKAAMRAVADACTWDKEDMGWLKAAPRYYFLCDEEGMPAQGHMNTGQKLWWFLVIIFGAVFIVTGLVMWFLKTVAPASLLQWMVFAHDVAFIVTGAMVFVHVYLGVIHPMMTEAWSAISKGTVSEEYAKSHHGLWYAEQVKEETPEPVKEVKVG
jgi:formate dehydrogenase subunit gamma